MSCEDEPQAEPQSLEYYLKNQPYEIGCPYCGGKAQEHGKAATGNACGWLAVTVYFCRSCTKIAFSSVGVSDDI